MYVCVCNGFTVEVYGFFCTAKRYSIYGRNDGRMTGNLRASCSVISLRNKSNDLEGQRAAQHRCEYTINKGELALNSLPYCALPFYVHMLSQKTD